MFRVVFNPLMASPVSAQGWRADGSLSPRPTVQCIGTIVALALVYYATSWAQKALDSALFFDQRSPVGLAALCAGLGVLGIGLWWVVFRRWGRSVVSTAAAGATYLFAAKAFTSSLPNYLGASVESREVAHWLIWAIFAVGAFRQRDGFLFGLLMMGAVLLTREFVDAEGHISALTLTLPALTCVATWLVPFNSSAMSTLALRAGAAFAVLARLALDLPEQLLGYTVASLPLFAVTGGSAVVFAAGELVPQLQASRRTGGAIPDSAKVVRAAILLCSAVIAAGLIVQIQLSAR